jgi:hypothetical protein
MHLQAVMKRIWSYTWRPPSSEFGAALGGNDHVCLEMHLEAVSERIWRYASMP